MTEHVELRPNPGPQEAYLATSADMCFFGGAAGGGKTYATLLDGLRWHADPDFDGVLFRREAVDLVGPGKVWDEAVGLFSLFGGSPRQSPVHEWTFPSGAAIAFTHLQHEKDKFAHQGGQYSWIAFEELTQFTETQFWYLWSRSRTRAKVRPYLRATCNPDPDSWVRKMIDWWIGPDGYAIPERSGVVRYFVRDDDDALVWADTREELEQRFGDPDRVTSFTFILSRLKDNPKVDPTYRASLLAMPLVERERLLGDEERGGNWDIRAKAGTVFKQEWFRHFVDSADELEVLAWMRAWDMAASEKTKENPNPPWTRGAKVGITRTGDLVLAHMAGVRGTSGTVEALVKATAELDGPGVKVGLWQDPGQAGKGQMERYEKEILRGFAVEVEVASLDKEAYAHLWSPLVEQGRFFIVRGPWNTEFILEVAGFPDAKLKDQVDAVSRAAVWRRKIVESMTFLNAMTSRGGLRGAVTR